MWAVIGLFHADYECFNQKFYISPSDNQLFLLDCNAPKDDHHISLPHHNPISVNTSVTKPFFKRQQPLASWDKGQSENMLVSCQLLKIVTICLSFVHGQHTVYAAAVFYAVSGCTHSPPFLSSVKLLCFKHVWTWTILENYASQPLTKGRPLSVWCRLLKA